MRRTLIGFTIVFPLGLASCNVESLLANLDAGQGLQALLGSLEAQPQEALQRDDTEFRGADDSLVDVSAPCVGGGTIAFVGTLELDNLGAEPGDIDPGDVDPNNPGDFDPVDAGDLVPTIKFTYGVALDGCTVDGVTIDGRLDYALSTAWNDGTQSLDFSWTYEGNVDFTGGVEGPCDFAFGGTANGEAADWFDANPANFAGDACGHNAADVLD